MSRLARKYLYCSPLPYLLLISIIAALAYLVLVPQLGFYKEDWYLIWTGHTRGGAAIIPLFTIDRPVAGYVYAVLYPLLGDHALAWQLMAFALRLAGGFLVYAIVKGIWPQARQGAAAIALLFTIYPGYLQQYDAVNKAFWLTSLTAALLSLALTVVSLQATRWWIAWTSGAAAVLLAAFYPTIIEFYVGFEAVRLALIWLIVRRRTPGPWLGSLIRTLLNFMPYILVALAFLVWRLFFFESTRPTTNVDSLFSAYTGIPWHMLGQVLSESVKDFIETVLLAWTVPFNNRLYPERLEDLLAGGVIGLAAAGLTLGVFGWLGRHSPPEDESPRTYRQWVWLGAFAAFITLEPLILAGRDVSFDRVARADHYTIQASFGAVMLLVALGYLFLPRRAILVVLACLVGVSVFTQFQQDVLMRDFWALQKKVWWQLSWRAPGINKGALLFVNLPPPFAFQEGYEAWAPANMLYAPQSNKVVIAGEVLDNYSMEDIIRGERKFKDHRSIRFTRNYSNSLVLSLPTSQSCLHVLDPSDPFLTPEDDALDYAIAPYSHASEIDPSGPGANPPPLIFGAEPAHDWCFYYEKAQLARQQGDWAEVARLGDKAESLGLVPYDRTEWMVFLEGYANTGRFEDAQKIAEIHIKLSDFRDHLCARLLTLKSFDASYQYDQIQRLLCK